MNRTLSNENMLNYKVLGIIALVVGSIGLIFGISLFNIEETVYQPDVSLNLFSCVILFYQ